MSRIEELIAEHCPDGVEFKNLGSLGRRNKGTSITAARMKILAETPGSLRIFAGGQTVADVQYNAIPKKEIVTEPSIIVRSRGHIGFGYYEEHFSHKTEMWSYTITDTDVNQKFVYYYLLTQVDSLQTLARSKSVKLPQLAVRDTDDLAVPVPPLPVQEEIVRILDKFSQLEAELEAELEARKQQYEHYRDQLIVSHSLEVNKIRLSNLCLIADGTHQTPQYQSNGVPFVSVENIQNLKDTKKFISEGAFLNEYKLKPQQGDLFMTRIGTIGSCAVVEDNGPLAYYVTLALIRPNNDLELNVRYLRHVFESKVGRMELRKRTLLTAVPIKINLGDISKIKIPLPNISDQIRIAETLDKFDALVNDISVGLPAELTARRQQYEYYRDKLLTFKELEVKS